MAAGTRSRKVRQAKLGEIDVNGQELNDAMAPVGDLTRRERNLNAHWANRLARAVRRACVSRGAYRQLRATEQKAYLRHLTRLDQTSIRQRFNRPMSDTGLAQHVERAFGSQGLVVIGWFKQGVLRGAAEIAVFRPNPDSGAPLAEAAFTVEPRYRRRGVGRQLMARATLIARNRRARTLLISTTWNNRAMLAMAASSGVRFTRGETEAEGRLATGRRTVYSVCLETMREEIGVLGWVWDHLSRRLRLRLRRKALHT